MSKKAFVLLSLLALAACSPSDPKARQEAYERSVSANVRVIARFDGCALYEVPTVIRNVYVAKCENARARSEWSEQSGKIILNHSSETP